MEGMKEERQTPQIEPQIEEGLSIPEPGRKPRKYGEAVDNKNAVNPASIAETLTGTDVASRQVSLRKQVKTQPTKRQVKLAENLLNPNTMTTKKALLNAGYSQSTAEAQTKGILASVGLGIAIRQAKALMPTLYDIAPRIKHWLNSHDPAPSLKAAELSLKHLLDSPEPVIEDIHAQDPLNYLNSPPDSVL